MKRSIYLLILISFLALIFTAQVDARSGCCSHHGGVCGCGCCDGSPLSAICAPYYPECNNSNTADTTTANTDEPTTKPYVAVVTFTPYPTYTPRPTRTPIPTRTPTSTLTLTPSITPTLTLTSLPKPTKHINPQKKAWSTKNDFWSWLRNLFFK